MLKVLLKKQFLELGKTYFRSKKTGKQMSRLGVFGFGLLLAFLYFSLAMSFIGMGALFLDALKPLKLDWLYFSIFSLNALILGVFIVMFYSMSILYKAKDNELLMSLPIKIKDIVLSRMIVLHFNVLIYTSVICLPTTIYYLFKTGFNVNILICSLLLWIGLSFIVLFLASAFGYLIAYISSKFKNKSYISTAITVLLLVAYYYFYFNISNYLNQIVIHINEIEIFVKEKLYLIYVLGNGALGNYLYVILVLLIGLLLVTVAIYFINKNFENVVTSLSVVTKNKDKKYKTKQKNIKETLISKELQHFLSNTTYTTNCGLGILFLVAGAICLFIFRNELLLYVEQLEMIMPASQMLPALILGVVVGISSTDALATPAVSLEGNTYWIARSLPVSTYDVLSAKRELQFRLNVVPTIIFIIVATSVFEIEGITQVLLLLASIIFVSFVSGYDLFLGIKGASLNWTSEVVPIKQSFNILIAVFSSFIFMLIIGFGYYLLIDKISIDIYLAVILLIFCLLSIFLDSWLKKKGTYLFENL